MTIAALFVWLITVLAGLFLLMIWIIEYDSEFQSAVTTRLPVPVISAHALLAIGGLMLWLGYLLVDEARLAWASVAVLGTVAVLGLIMAARWIPRVPRLRRPRPFTCQERYRPSGTQLSAAGRRRPWHLGRRHPRFGVADRAWHWRDVTSHLRPQASILEPEVPPEADFLVLTAAWRVVASQVVARRQTGTWCWWRR